ARPRNLIQNDTLIEVDQDPNTPTIPYIAVSYTWDPDPTLCQWHGRPVTTQALGIASRLARYTSLALWIDAICIAQNDPRAKEEELPKMADIYRGAVGVVCLVGDVTSRTCALVQRGVQLTRHAAGRALQDAGDIYGAYMFATAGENTALEAMFGHRWWERAWTFQEAVLNRHTYIVGEAEDTIPIDEVLELGLVVRRRAASTAGMKMGTLGRPSAFWDSVAAMSVAAQRPLSLGESIACVWRRNA
ncbi:heterokaryon incompatibility protein-domain-containing protein, partial [Trametes elegans]